MVSVHLVPVPDVHCCVPSGIYKCTFTHKKLGITKEQLAGKVLPHLIPLSIENNLNLNQVGIFYVYLIFFSFCYLYCVLVLSYRYRWPKK